MSSGDQDIPKVERRISGATEAKVIKQFLQARRNRARRSGSWERRHPITASLGLAEERFHKVAIGMDRRNSEPSFSEVRAQSDLAFGNDLRLLDREVEVSSEGH